MPNSRYYSPLSALPADVPGTVTKLIHMIGCAGAIKGMGKFDMREEPE